MNEAYEKQFQKMVDSGKMTQKQADQQLAMMEKIMSPTLFKVLGILGAVLAAPSVLCLIALFFWLVGVHLFHGVFDFYKAMEVVGLANMINVLGGIIYVLLVVIFGTMYINVGPVLFLSHFDPTNHLHLVLLSFNVMSLWYLVVLSIGLARISRASFLKSAACIFAAWLLLKFIPMVTALAFQKMFSGVK